MIAQRKVKIEFGRIRSSGVSPDPRIARENAERRATFPVYYSDDGIVMKQISEREYLDLLKQAEAGLAIEIDK